jgi:hypothetical protein
MAVIRFSMPTTVPETGEKIGTYQKLSEGSPIFCPTFTLSPSFTSGVQAALPFTSGI